MTGPRSPHGQANGWGRGRRNRGLQGTAGGLLARPTPRVPRVLWDEPTCGSAGGS